MMITAQLNACDHDHMTNSETRLLPIGGDGNVIVCESHYRTEMTFRRGKIALGIPFDLPAWDTLKVYGEVQS